MLKLKGECSLGIRDWTILWPLCVILWLNFDGIASLKLIFLYDSPVTLYYFPATCASILKENPC